MGNVEVVAIDYGGTLSDPAAEQGGVTPAAATTIRALHQAGYRLVLSSNTRTDKPRRPMLAAAGIEHMFHAVIESHEIGAAKPDPAFYRALIAAAGCPARIVHVGNRLDNDVLIPREAGMQAVLLRQPTPPGITEITELPQLLTLLSEWNTRK